MKIKLLTGVGMTFLTLSCQAVLYSTNWNGGFANGGLIPDGNLSGWSDTRNVTTMPGGILNSVAVDLHLTGGWNGDLYAYLVHGSGFCVLLDAVGTPGLTYGYGNPGMNVTLADNGTILGLAQGNIHAYGGAGVPTGTWNPDATSGSLGSFLLTTPNGTWSLFMADRSTGEITTVQSWGMQLDIVAVPEVETWVAAGLAGAFGAFWLNRQLLGRKRD